MRIFYTFSPKAVFIYMGIGFTQQTVKMNIS